MENKKTDSNTSTKTIVSNMNIYLIIRRKKVTLYLDVQDVTVLKLKQMIEALLKIRPVDQRLFVVFVDNCFLDKYTELSDSSAFLSNYGLNSAVASITCPATLGLTVRQEDGSFEDLEMTPYSNSEWPELSELSIENKDKCTIFHEQCSKMFEKLSVAKACRDRETSK